MGYLPVGISEEERQDILLELRKREVELAEREYQDKQKGRLWRQLSTVATVAVPLLTFLGVKEYLAARRRRAKKG